jgi:mitofilin
VCCIVDLVKFFVDARSYNSLSFVLIFGAHLQQIPSFLSSRKEFSTVSKQNTPSHSGSAGKPPESGGSLPKVIVGSVAIGAAFFAAYQTGYLDQLLGKQQQSSLRTAKIGVENRDAKDIQHSIEQLGSGGAEEPNKFDIDHPGQQSVSHENEDPNKVSPTAEHAEQKVEAHLDLPHLEPLSERQGDDQTQVQDKSEMTPAEGFIPVQEKDLPEYSRRSEESNDQGTDSGISPKGSLDIKSTEEDTSKTQNEIHTGPVPTQGGAVLEESDMKTLPPEHLSTEKRPEVLCLSLLNPLHIS